MNIVQFDIVESTNEIIKDNKYANSIVLAKNQSKGKGRYSNNFYCYEGGLYFSFRLTNHKNLESITIAMALAINKYFNENHGIDLEIKWLNDLYINNKKVSGILCEKIYHGNIYQYTIVGTGINLVKDIFNTDIKDKVGYIFDEIDIDYTQIANNLVLLFTEFLEDDRLIEIYKDKSNIINKTVSFDDKQGIVIDITSSGLLKVKHDNETVYLDYSNTKVRFKND